MHLKQHMLKAGRVRHCGIRSFALLKPLFCSQKTDLSFLTCMPLVITEEPSLEVTSGLTFVGQVA